MKTIVLSVVAGAFIAVIGLLAVGPSPAAAERHAVEQASANRPIVLEGKDKPILLGRMVVTATPLDGEGQR